MARMTFPRPVAHSLSATWSHWSGHHSKLCVPQYPPLIRIHHPKHFEVGVHLLERRKEGNLPSKGFFGLWYILNITFCWWLQNFIFGHPLWGDWRFLLGWSCERSCACHSLVDSSYQQPIGLNYTSFGAWEAASTTTRCRQVDLGCAILTIFKESRSL